MTAYTDRLRAQIATHEAEIVRLAADRDRAYGSTSGDPAVARLAATALRQHHRSTDADLGRWALLTRRIDGHRHRAAWKRARLAKHETADVS